jgi:nitrite reductase/ring-hydroxylating ferredoxin subunit
MGFKKFKWYKVADKETDLQWTSGGVAEVEVNGKKLCVGRFQDQWYGFAHTCPHAGASLTDGYIDGACNVVCPVHQLKFSLKNGRDANGEGYRLKTFPVETRPEGIFMGVEEGGLFKWF